MTCYENKRTCRHFLAQSNGKPYFCRKYQVILDQERKKPVRFERCEEIEFWQWDKK